MHAHDLKKKILLSIRFPFDDHKLTLLKLESLKLTSSTSLINKFRRHGTYKNFPKPETIKLSPGHQDGRMEPENEYCNFKGTGSFNSTTAMDRDK